MYTSGGFMSWFRNLSWRFIPWFLRSSSHMKATRYGSPYSLALMDSPCASPRPADSVFKRSYLYKYICMEGKKNHCLMENSGKNKKGWKRLGSSRDAYSEVFSALWHSLQEWGEYFTVYPTNSVQLCLETEKSYGYSSRCWTHLRSPVQLSTPSLLWGKLRLVTCMNFHELLW